MKGVKEKFQLRRFPKPTPETKVAAQRTDVVRDRAGRFTEMKIAIPRVAQLSASMVCLSN